MTTPHTGVAQPLLSICLPVYNGAEYLPNVLAALLSQADELREVVEVMVADDASQDASEQICAEAAAAGRIRYVRNCPNLGMGPNIARCITEHARGTYVWIWSQHCLIRPKMLIQIVQLLQKHRDRDVVTLNFRCARYPDLWPARLENSYDGEFDYVSNADLRTLELDHWHLALTEVTGLGTQTYSHIVRCSVVAEYLKQQRVDRCFGTAVSTYTQATAVGATCFHRPALYFGEPVFTIFNGAQTWSRLDTRALVYLQAFPELVSLYVRQGLSGDRRRSAEHYVSGFAAATIQELLRRDGVAAFGVTLRYLLKFGGQYGAIRATGAVLLFGDWCRLSACLLASVQLASRVGDYIFRRCRPARWVRSLGRAAGSGT